MFIDVHCHLDLLKDIDSSVSSASEKDVRIVTAGVDKNTNRKSLELSEKYENVSSCLGIYPIDALKMSDSEIDAEIEFIRENKDKIVGIGEVGIDYKESEEKEKQKKIFSKF